MSELIIASPAKPPGRAHAATEDSSLTRYAVISITVIFLALFLFAPLIVVFVEAISKGWPKFFETFDDPDALAAVRLTLLVAVIVKSWVVEDSVPVKAFLLDPAFPRIQQCNL